MHLPYYKCNTLHPKGFFNKRWSWDIWFIMHTHNTTTTTKCQNNWSITCIMKNTFQLDHSYDYRKEKSLKFLGAKERGGLSFGPKQDSKSKGHRERMNKSQRCLETTAWSPPQAKWVSKGSQPRGLGSATQWKPHQCHSQKCEDTFPGRVRCC